VGTRPQRWRFHSLGGGDIPSVGAKIAVLCRVLSTRFMHVSELTIVIVRVEVLLSFASGFICMQYYPCSTIHAVLSMQYYPCSTIHMSVQYHATQLYVDLLLSRIGAS